MVDALAKGERIEIRGFGSFDLRYWSPRIARDPKTGGPVQFSAKVAVHFKPGKEMRGWILREIANAFQNDGIIHLI